MRSTIGVLVLLAAGAAWAGEAKKEAEQAAPATLDPKEAADGFVSLFDGKTLKGWQGSVKGYAVEDGIMVCQKHGGGNVYTEKEYGNFVFRFEFKLEPGANNGVGIRAPLQGDAAYVGMEIQILDNDAPVYKNLQPYQYHGSIYGVVPAKRGFLKPNGEWNSEEILADGKHIRVTLNGTVIVDANLDDVKDPKVLAAHPGLKRDKGYIGFLGHGARIEFRNLRVKEL